MAQRDLEVKEEEEYDRPQHPSDRVARLLRGGGHHHGLEKEAPKLAAEKKTMGKRTWLMLATSDTLLHSQLVLPCNNVHTNGRRAAMKLAQGHRFA